ncbi:putative adhesin [Streptomyces vinaceus]|uniref:putative adhesin n=1 Tax=Streptomyces vinaceus TaxID=1960 RepID=UPI00382F9D42
MQRIFVAGHGLLYDGHPIKTPEGFSVRLYADPGESAAIGNLLGAINSGGAIGARTEYGAGSPNKEMPHYTLTPFEQKYVDRCHDSISSVTGGIVYVLGSHNAQPGTALLDHPGSQYNLRTLFKELTKKHGSLIELHLLCCLTSADRQDDGESPSVTLAVGDEPKMPYDDDLDPQYDDEDDRYFPALHRQARRLNQLASHDPQRAFEEMERMPRATRAQLLSATLDEEGIRHLRPDPADFRSFMEAGSRAFPDIITGATGLPCDAVEACRCEQARNAFYAYLNLAARVRTAPPWSITFFSLLGMISTLPPTEDPQHITYGLEIQDFIHENGLLDGDESRTLFDASIAEKLTLHRSRRDKDNDLLADFYSVDRTEFESLVKSDSNFLEKKALEADSRTEDAIRALTRAVLVQGELDFQWGEFCKLISVVSQRARRATPRV